MTSLAYVRRMPQPGDVGCVGACPLCRSATGRPVPPCLACREELRARLADMQLAYYAARAVN